MLSSLLMNMLLPSPSAKEDSSQKDIMACFSRSRNSWTFSTIASTSLLWSQVEQCWQKSRTKLFLILPRMQFSSDKWRSTMPENLMNISSSEAVSFEKSFPSRWDGSPEKGLVLSWLFLLFLLVLLFLLLFREAFCKKDMEQEWCPFPGGLQGRCSLGGRQDLKTELGSGLLLKETITDFFRFFRNRSTSSGSEGACSSVLPIRTGFSFFRQSTSLQYFILGSWLVLTRSMRCLAHRKYGSLLASQSRNLDSQTTFPTSLMKYFWWLSDT